MPVPGSLRRRPVDERELAELLQRQFEIKPVETKAYLRLLEGLDMTPHELALALDIPLAETHALLERMLSSGLIIRATGSETRFAPLHPRMTMTNIFKIYEKGVIDALRSHRATVDRVVNMLEPIYEDRKIHRS
jgi:sugar-specific transcriptional regulator TrmB